LPHLCRVQLLLNRACGRDVHLGAILDFSFPNHPDCATIVSLNCHVSTAQGAQPDIFQRARLACVFQIGRKLHRWRSRGRDHVELSFVEITKDSRTVWIRTLREHQASRLGSYCLPKQSETNLFDGGIDRCPRKTRHGLSHTLPSVGTLHLPFKNSITPLNKCTISRDGLAANHRQGLASVPVMSGDNICACQCPASSCVRSASFV